MKWSELSPEAKTAVNRVLTAVGITAFLDNDDLDILAVCKAHRLADDVVIREKHDARRLLMQTTDRVAEMQSGVARLQAQVRALEAGLPAEARVPSALAEAKAAALATSKRVKA
jgi:hypothetical protein